MKRNIALIILEIITIGLLCYFIWGVDHVNITVIQDSVTGQYCVSEYNYKTQHMCLYETPKGYVMQNYDTLKIYVD